MPYSTKLRDAVNPVEISKWRQNEGIIDTQVTADPPVETRAVRHIPGFVSPYFTSFS
jgi:hypothetical protein